MGRPKVKENRAVTVRMEATLADRLDAYCEDSGQSKTLAIERAVERYMDDYYAERELLARARDLKTDTKPQ